MSSLALEEPRSKSPRLRADSLADGVLIVLCLMVVQRAIGFGRGVLFCRWLDPAEFGRWGLAFNFLLLAAPIAVLGLPGSFGRYLEYYRQRGQLGVFLRRTTLWTTLLASAAICGILLALPTFSELIFGEPDMRGLVALTAIALAGVILHHFLESLYMAMRMNRVVSGMQFCQSVGFALFGGLLLWQWRMDAASLVVGYSLATLLSALGGVLFLRGVLPEQDSIIAPLPQRTFWAKLLPFAMWMWMANVLANLFGMVDRYMLVHYANLSPHEAMTQVGYYQSSLIVPALLVSVAELFATILTPHLSRDWERGEQELVARRLNLALKVAAALLLLGSTCVLLVAPLMFEVVLAGKYAGGLDILPLTLVYSSWFGLTLIINNYLWCAERAKWCSVALCAGLIANVGLNLLLLPKFGLMGAVLATTIANAITLAATVWLSRAVGMHFSAGACCLLLAPLVLALGAGAAVCAILLGLLIVCRTAWIMNAEEKQIVLSALQDYWRRVARVALLRQHSRTVQKIFP